MQDALSSYHSQPPFLPTPIMVGVAGAPSLMLSVLHTNVIARQYFILSFNLVALCFSESVLSTASSELYQQANADIQAFQTSVP